MIIVGVTTLYTVVGGLYSVVLTDLIQFLIMIVCSIAMGLIAMQRVSPEVVGGSRAGRLARHHALVGCSIWIGRT